MDLHLPTLLWFMGLTSFTMAAAVLIVAGRSRAEDGLSHWGASLACHGLTYPLFALRFHGWLDLSIVLTCLTTSATLALNIQAVSLFQRAHRRPPGLLQVWLPVLATGVVALLTVHDHVLRNVLAAVITVAQSIVLAWLALRPGATYRLERSRILLVLGSAALVFLLALRAVAILQQHGWSGAFGVPLGIQSSSYLFALMILLFNTVGFLLMQKEKAVDEQRTQANHDPLTGVYNRRALMDRLVRIVETAVTGKQYVSMLMLDVDRFKRVNDTYGHLVGDDVLAAICQRITGRLRHGDLFARFGGEEFIVVLPGTRQRDAFIVAEAIREVVCAEPVTANGEPIPVTISVGVHSEQPQRCDGTVDHMISACDAALYRAKHKGRNRVEGADLASAP